MKLSWFMNSFINKAVSTHVSCNTDRVGGHMDIQILDDGYSTLWGGWIRITPKPYQAEALMAQTGVSGQ
jgi:hypothetical protein